MRFRNLLLACLAGVIAITLLIPNIESGQADEGAQRFPLDLWDPDLIAATREPKLMFLPESADIAVPPHPQEGGAEAQAELTTLLEYQRSARTPAQVSQIFYEDGRYASAESWGEVFLASGHLSHAHDPMLALNLGEMLISSDLDYFVLREKLRHGRLRPQHVLAEIRPVIEMPPHASYPSGHAAQAYLMALILSEVDPQGADAYLSFAREVGRRREIAGVHFASDTAAGISLAYQVLEQAMTRRHFAVELSAATQAFHGTP